MHGAGPVDEESQSQKEASAPAADVNATAKGNIDDDDVYGDDRRSHFAPPRKTKRVYTSSSQEKKQKQLRKTSCQLDDNDDAPRDDDGDEPRQQRHPASTTAALAFRPRNLAFESIPETPSPLTRTRGNGLRSAKRKNYAASNANIPQDVIIKLRSRTDPSYIDTERIQPAGTVCEQIIDQTWGDDFTGTVTWHDGPKNVNNGTQRAAIVVQASADLAPQPCVHCVNNGGTFDHCKVNAVWPVNGTCASCAYWGHRKKHCSLTDRNTPRKASKTTDSAISRLEAELNDSEATLRRLQEDLMSSCLINWDEEKKNPQGVKRDREKVLEYLDIEANIMANLVDSGDRLISVLKRRRFLRRALEKNPFVTKPLTEDEESDADFELGIQEMERQQERRKSRKAQEHEIEDSPLKHKKRTITKPIDDEEDDE
ncbi:hypothetical protein KEM55_007460 [Ascosphaera atra]|nr:hypothetical protein KEM55_007460 [Ascosphaera atra]